MAPNVDVLRFPVSTGMTTWGRDDLPDSAQERAELRDKVHRVRVEWEKKERGQLDASSLTALRERHLSSR